MKVFVYPEKTHEDFGATRFEISYEAVKPAALSKEDIDPDRDIDFISRSFKDLDSARTEARRIVDAYATAFGQVTIQKQQVKWFVERDQIAEWADVDEPEYID